jgi:hypothetical protein
MKNSPQRSIGLAGFFCLSHSDISLFLRLRDA